MNKHTKTNEANRSVRRSILVQESAYGFNKYQLADKMRNCFHISDNFLSGLDVYHMKHERGNFFATMLEDGTLSFASKSKGEYLRYAVIYNGCTPYNAKRATEVRLSFRAAKPEFGIEPIVLVQIVDMGGQ